MWDHRNRLIEVLDYDSSDDMTQEVDYAYDANNHLIKRVVDTDGELGSDPVEQTVYAWQHGQIVYQFDKTGSGALGLADLSHRYLWGPAVDMLLADEQVDWGDSDADGEILWALTDHLGTVRDIIDNDGDVLDHAEYDAFGNRLNAAAVDVVFGYTGKLFDEYTGLQNNWNRWYDPAVGRWVSEDFVWDGTNKNAYVGNKATTYIDQNGLEETSFFDLINPFSWWYGNPIKWRERDRIIQERQTKAMLSQPSVDKMLEHLHEINRQRRQSAADNCTELATTGINLNAAILSGTFVRPGAPCVGSCATAISRQFWNN